MIALDFAPEKQAVIEQALQMLGMQITDFIQESVYQIALDMLEPNQVWQVTDKQIQVIATGFNDDTPANDDLKTLLALVK